jgi:hypothetical protein
MSFYLQTYIVRDVWIRKSLFYMIQIFADNSTGLVSLLELRRKTLFVDIEIKIS